MIESDLQSFVTRSHALVGSAPPKTRRDTRTWLVEPVLDCLGWRVRDGACKTDRTLAETRFEYVLTISSVPAVLVAVEAAADSLDESRATNILEAMAWTDIDRAIYTNGRDYLLFAGTTNAEQLSCRLESLPDHEPSLQHYTKHDARQRLENDARTAVARQLAVERTALTDAIVGRLESSTGTHRYMEEFEAAADRFLDQLVVAFTDQDQTVPAETGGISLEYTSPSVSSDESGGITGDRGDIETADTRPDASLSDDELEEERTAETAVTDDEPSELDGDGEYVVRFFDDRSSVGAIGHSSPTQALIHATEYCLERGLAGVSVPWSPSEDAETVLNDEPVRDDGSPMTSPEQLSNGYYLETGGSVGDQAERIEEVAARAGLRAMLTGDWDR